MIIKEPENILFFDGINNQHCQMKNEYWLGSSAPEKHLNATVFFFNGSKEEITIKLFESSQNTFHKNLSDYQAPKIGFYKEDLFKLAEQFKFKLLKNTNGNKEGYSVGNPLKLIIKFEKDNLFFLIYSINGGRAPESVYFFGLYEVAVDTGFKNKYIVPTDI